MQARRLPFIKIDPMLPRYVLLDLETTGAIPLRDRITEIALIGFEDGVEVSRWQTLVNPEATIPPFIQRLTGISPEMVDSAPLFKQVAGELLDYLHASVVCAHNVRFDHGFLKNEFKRMGINLRVNVLCTVKLSRKLYPHHRSHSLDAIISRHSLTCRARHRAMGDVEMMVAFLDSATREFGPVRISETAHALLQAPPSLPSGIDAHVIDELPDTPGVYLFFGESALPLYIGKSINLRQRVMSHFGSDHSSTKEMRISQEIKHIEWIETAGEFSALLLESRLVKERQPIYNRRLRRQRQLCSWRLATSAEAHPLVSLVREDEIQPGTLGQLFGMFRSKRQAVEVLRHLADQHHLCLKCLGLEAGKGGCFAQQLKRCKGVCTGQEAPEIHFLRLQQAMMAHRLKTWPYPGKIGLYEHHEINNKSVMHIFEHWVHLTTVDQGCDLNAIAATHYDVAFDLDTYLLLSKELRKPHVKIVELASIQTA